MCLTESRIFLRKATSTWERWHWPDAQSYLYVSSTKSHLAVPNLHGDLFRFKECGPYPHMAHVWGVTFALFVYAVVRICAMLKTAILWVPSVKDYLENMKESGLHAYSGSFVKGKRHIFTAVDIITKMPSAEVEKLSIIYLNFRLFFYSLLENAMWNILSLALLRCYSVILITDCDLVSSLLSNSMYSPSPRAVTISYFK